MSPITGPIIVNVPYTRLKYSAPFSDINTHLSIIQVERCGEKNYLQILPLAFCKKIIVVS